MFRTPRFWALLLVCALVLTAFALPISAQDGMLFLGQPVAGNLTAEQPTLTLTYDLAQDSTVVIEAFGEQVAPTITITREGAVVAEQPNPETALTTSLTAQLSAGSYAVQIGAANGANGLVIVVVDSETPISVVPLTMGVPVSGLMSVESTVTIYSIDALTVPAYLYISTTGFDAGGVRVVDVATGGLSALVGVGVDEARLRLAPNASAYRVEVNYTGTGNAAQFTLCYIGVGMDGCQVAPVELPAPVDVPPATFAPTPPPAVVTCAVTPLNAGGANIRQTTNVNAPLAGALPGGTSVPVLARNPESTWYNISYNGVNGWVSGTAVSVSGDCAGLAAINPPPFLPPSPTPVPPTVAPPTPSGPCLIRITGAANVYQTPLADISNLYDQVQAGYELIPNGRLGDNSWWRTNYNGAWIQTSLFGNVAQVSGDCRNLPVVSP